MRAALLLPALAGSLAVSAQNFPFPTSDATWVQYFEMMVSPPPLPNFEVVSTSNLCIDGSDTLIAGVSYTRISQCNAGYLGAIRSAVEAVYFLPADSIQEFLLYDFGAGLGDTVHDVFVNEGLAYAFTASSANLIDYRVAQVGQVAGRRWLMLQQLWGGPEQYWIEGFGSPYGLFSQQSPMNISGYWAGIACMSHQDSVWYFSEWEITSMSGTCTPQYVGFDELLSIPVTLFPNPTTGTSTLTGMDAGNGPVVRDAMGRLVVVPTVRSSNDALQLDFSAMACGLYLISNSSGNAAVRLMRE